MCSYINGNTTSNFEESSGVFSFMTEDRKTFGDDTFTIEIVDISHYGTFSYSLSVKLIDLPAEHSNTYDLIVEDDYIQLTLNSAPCHRYSFEPEEPFDVSIDIKAVPSSGGFYFEESYTDPFGCFFRNVRLSNSGEYETQS